MARVVKCIKPATGLEVGKLYEVSCDAYDLIHVGGEHDGHSRDCFEYVRAVSVLPHQWYEVVKRDNETFEYIIPSYGRTWNHSNNNTFTWSELPIETPEQHPLTKYTRKSTMGESPRVIPTIEQLTNCKNVLPSDQIGGTHYAKNDPIQFARDNYPKEQLEGFFRINVDKYVARYDKKNGVEDLKKARHYLDMLIDLKEVK